MKSCLYHGQVSHRRRLPREHRFNYRLFYLFLDLDELPELFKRYWFWSADKPAIAWFKREDHSGDPRVSLKQYINQVASKATGRQHSGPVRLLTHLRYWGHCFNPVSIYYCYDELEQIQSIVCEVNNTPWGERHLYVLDAQEKAQTQTPFMSFTDTKQFHVSPFMPLAMDYTWRFNQPAEQLSVYMSNHGNSAEINKQPATEGQYQMIFDASLDLKRKPINHFQLARVLIMYPLMTVKVVMAIYYQALRLWLKKIPFFSHPGKNSIIEENQS